MIPLISSLLIEKDFAVIAIDGGSGSGKSTMAAQLAMAFNANLFHMDDFFLPEHMRNETRFAIPGGNAHHERFLSEVLLPLKEKRPFSYRPFDCSAGDFKEEIAVTPKALNIIEGSYSLYPTLAEHYDLRFFLKISKEEQERRIRSRNTEEMQQLFFSRWIPLEDAYFEAFKIEESCHRVVEIK